MISNPVVVRNRVCFDGAIMLRLIMDKQFAEPGATAQRPQLSRVVLAHAPRQPGSWLTWDVGRKKMRSLACVFILAVIGCAVSSAEKTQSPAGTDERKDPQYGAILPTKEEEVKVPLVRILANPEKFENHWVQTGGYLVLEFEHCALYFSKEDSEHGLTMNGVWIRPDFRIENPKLVSKRYVILDGIFTMKDHGHLGMWQGAIRATCIRFSDWESEPPPPPPKEEPEPNQRPEGTPGKSPSSNPSQVPGAPHP